MYFDALTLAAVAGELRTHILDGRIQRVVRPTTLSIGLEIYNHGQRRHLLLSAHPQFARVHLLRAKPSRGVEGETPLLLLLRKYVLGGRIVQIEQPELERILILSIVKGPFTRNTAEAADVASDAEETDEQLRCELIVEAMDRRSNIILVGDDNIIKESVRHVTPLMSRRPVQPREPYELPPRQEKLNPFRATPDGIRSIVEKAEESDVARALVSAYRGLSPQVAREVVFRVLGQIRIAPAPDLPWEQLAATLRSLVETLHEPSLALEEGDPKAYAPYLLTQFSHVEPQPSISAALETFYASREQLTSHQQRRGLVLQTLAETRERLERQRQQLEAQMEQARELDRLRWEGEMIYAFMYNLQPGQTTLEVEGQMIKLDPSLSPVENAQARFRSYDKAKGALANVPELLQATEAKIAGLDETVVLLTLAEGFEQIEDITREAEEQGYLKTSATSRKRMKVRRQPPLRLVSSDNFTIYVGRSAGQNEQVTFTIAAPDDLWLHVRNIPGAHVVVKSGGGDVPQQTLLEAAGLAAYFSAARNDTSVEVEVSRRRLVKRIPGGPLGLVTYRSEQTLRVAPRAPW